MNTVVISQRKKKTLDKYFNLIKVILVAVPVLCLMYLTMNASMMGMELKEIIEADPTIAVMLLIAMINPFVAYLLTFIHRKLEQGDLSYVVVNLTFLLLIEAMLLNIIYIAMVGFLLYQVIKTYRVSIRDPFTGYTPKELVRTISGCLAMLPIAMICMFVQLRLGML